MGLPLAALVVRVALGAEGVWLAFHGAAANGNSTWSPRTMQEFYADSVKDTAVADEDEIMPLVTLKQGESVTIEWG